jgi:hypothetical protein
MSEEILFESTLRDAVLAIAVDIDLCWTLKFENGAIIRVKEKDRGASGTGPIWWVGRKYCVRVVKGESAWPPPEFIVELLNKIEEP